MWCGGWCERIYLVRHAFLHSAICYYIDHVADFVLLEVGGKRDHALLLEVAGEGCVGILASDAISSLSAAVLVFFFFRSLRLQHIAIFLALATEMGDTDHSECPL